MSFERRKIRTGIVVGDKMDKAIVVLVKWSSRHLLYGKLVRHTTKFSAHDGGNQSKVGDLVSIIESRPLSKSKRWRLKEILVSAEFADVQPGEILVDESVVPTRRRGVQKSPVSD